MKTKPAFIIDGYVTYLGFEPFDDPNSLPGRRVRSWRVVLVRLRSSST